MSTETYCCPKFKDMVDDYRIQRNDNGDYIIWTCEGDTGEYSTYGEPDCDGISYCPWCGKDLSKGLLSLFEHRD